MVLDTQIINDQILVSSRNHLALYDTNNLGDALWSQPRLPMNGDQSKRNILRATCTQNKRSNHLLSLGLHGNAARNRRTDLSTGKGKWLHDDSGFGAGKIKTLFR